MGILTGDKRRNQVFDKFGGRCAYCGSNITLNNFHVDHIKPLRRYLKNWERGSYPGEVGDNEMSNYNPACAPCNISKSTLSVEDWRSEIKQKFDRLVRDDSRFRLLCRFGIIQKNDTTDFKFYFEKNG